MNCKRNKSSASEGIAIIGVPSREEKRIAHCLYCGSGRVVYKINTTILYNGNLKNVTAYCCRSCYDERNGK